MVLFLKGMSSVPVELPTAGRVRERERVARGGANSRRFHAECACRDCYGLMVHASWSHGPHGASAPTCINCEQRVIYYLSHIIISGVLLCARRQNGVLRVAATWPDERRTQTPPTPRYWLHACPNLNITSGLTRPAASTPTCDLPCEAYCVGARHGLEGEGREVGQAVRGGDGGPPGHCRVVARAGGVGCAVGDALHLRGAPS